MLANWELSVEDAGAARVKAADIVADNCIDVSDVAFAVLVANMALYDYQIPQDGTFAGAVLPQ